MLFPKKAIKEIEGVLKNLKEENRELQIEISKNILNIKTIDTIKTEDLKTLELIKKIFYLGYMTKEDKNIILTLLESLYLKLNEKEYSLKENFEILKLIDKINEFLEHEKEYLNYTPGAVNKEYVKLLDLIKSKKKVLIIDKAKLELKGDSLYYENKIIQGFKIGKVLNNLIGEISGEHFSNFENIKEIFKNEELTSSKLFFGYGDNYCYLVESGRLNGLQENEIKKILGASYASCSILVNTKIEIEKIWIRVKRGYPAKFALEGSKLKVNAVKPQKGWKVKIEGKDKIWK